MAVSFWEVRWALSDHSAYLCAPASLHQPDHSVSSTISKHGPAVSRLSEVAGKKIGLFPWLKIQVTEAWYNK
jgi:hypothetical protein